MLQPMAEPGPTVSLAALHAAIPRRCFLPSTARSTAHLLGDLTALALLYLVAAHTSSLILLSTFWFLQGTLFWSLFVIGHDCGHGAFSRSPRLNAVVGHFLHTPLLVPYHSWRLSHRLHHRHAGDIERDETWFPLTGVQWHALPWGVRLLRSQLFFLVFPLYLIRRTPGRLGSHFDAKAEMFPDGERGRVRTSVRLCAAMAALLACAVVLLGPWPVMKFWLGPYLVFCGWIGLVTYLHHTDASIPWYRGEEWSWLRGALSTMDRRYGIFEKVHHDAGCHVVHHLFPTIPHYRLREAAAAIKPLLGEQYREDRRPIWRALLAALRQCQVVPEDGGLVYYERLPGRAPVPSSRPSGAGSRPATT
jgi:omega-3 fatty acid desaturase (delta-15 desaturase)